MVAPDDTVLRVARLDPATGAAFDLAPDAEARATLAAALGLSALRKLRFTGRVSATGQRDWRLDGQLGATVVQPCVVTLAPVTTRIDQPVRRLYAANVALPEPGTEVEIPEDDDAEPLPETIDLAAVMQEALALAVPTYPRADGAELGAANFTEPGQVALTDEAARPFAGLADLRARLDKKPGSGQE